MEAGAREMHRATGPFRSVLVTVHAVEPDAIGVTAIVAPMMRRKYLMN